MQKPNRTSQSTIFASSEMRNTAAILKKLWKQIFQTSWLTEVWPLGRLGFEFWFVCHSFNLQSFSKYFEALWCFNKFPFHHNGNDAQFLLINMVYTSCLMSCRMTWGFFPVYFICLAHFYWSCIWICCIHAPVFQKTLPGTLMSP